MKNNIIGFGLSAMLHVTVAAQLWLPNTTEVKPKETAVPLSMAMFQEPKKVVPVEKPVQKEVVKKVQEKIQPPPEPIVEKVVPIEKPKEVVKKPIEKKPVVVKPKPVIPKPKKKVAKKPPKKPLVKKKHVKKVVKKLKKVTPTQLEKDIAELLKPKVAPVRAKRVVKPTRKPQVQKNRPHVARSHVPVKRTVARKVPRTNTARTLPNKKRMGSARANANTLARFEKAYKSRLRQLIESQKKYPRRAKRRGDQGVVKVSFIVSANGAVSQIQIVKSSGSRILDNAAKSAISKISMRLPFPKEINKSQWRFSLPLTYRFRS